METKKLTYIPLVLLHILLGVLLFFIPFLAKIISILIVVVGLSAVIKNKNKNNEVLYASAYMIGIEVLMRMTEGMFFNEFAKYSVMIFMFVGMIYSGFSKNALPYLFFLLFLLPGVILSTTNLSLEADVRKAIAFNISGPVCLAVASIYCYRRKVTFDQINLVIISLSLPIISLATYLFLYNPSVKDVITGTASNFETSGGFGPNQVSTILGLGIFVFFALLMLYSKSKRLLLLHALLTGIVAFRGIVTFSRGGVITGIIMILLLLVVVYKNAGTSSKLKIIYISGAAVLFSLAIWSYSSSQTNGLIDKRYANQDAAGREKEDRLGGREEIALTEVQMFLDHPVLGIGVGKNKEYRAETTGIEA
ncbi:MAG TPA: O-antigen ligase family protein, partial [Flavobacterium sp.]|nr:O-antigen ligase family protein [Flavobacterium sp.]